MGHEENDDATDKEKDENRVGPESSETMTTMTIKIAQVNLCCLLQQNVSCVRSRNHQADKHGCL